MFQFEKAELYCVSNPVSIVANLELVQTKIAEAAARSHRGTDEVELLAVSKTFAADLVREAWDAGQKLFGENRVQELLSKQPLLPDKLRWHLIGHLQSNKVRKVLPAVEAIHSVDSLELAQDINRIAAELGLFPKVYLEVNVAGEATKHGLAPIKLDAVFEKFLALPRLEILGLMCVPPIAKKPEDNRSYFAQLREQRDRMEKQFDLKLPGLSMGMSGDYDIAVEEGATIVRVGSAIFGGR